MYLRPCFGPKDVFCTVFVFTLKTITVSSTGHPRIPFYFVKNLGGEADGNYFSYVEDIPGEYFQVKKVTFFFGNRGSERTLWILPFSI